MASVLSTETAAPPNDLPSDVFHDMVELRRLQLHGNNLTECLRQLI